MSNYSKLFGAILGAAIGQALLAWWGVDLDALGVAGEVEALAIVAVEAVITAGSAGIATYFAPANKPT